MEASKAWNRHPVGFSVAHRDGWFSEGPGRDAACGWAVVQLDDPQEEELWHAMSGTIQDDIEVQRTIKRAVLWALMMALRGPSGAAATHTDNMGILGCLWKGEEEGSDPKQKDADLWTKIRGLLQETDGQEWHLGCEAR